MLYLCNVKPIHTHAKLLTKMTSSHINPFSLRQRILGLAIGESMFVLIEDYTENAARHCASELSFRFDRKYKVNRERERRGFTVTREA